MSGLMRICSSSYVKRGARQQQSSNANSKFARSLEAKKKVPESVVCASGWGMAAPECSGMF